MTGEEKEFRVDTELDFSSGTIIGNMYLFKDASGSAQYGLVDGSNRQIISSNSTITAIPSGTQDVDVVANSVGLMQSTSGTLAEVTLIPTISTVSDITTGTLAEVTLVPNVTTVGTVSTVTGGNITTDNSSTANIVIQSDNASLMKTTSGTLTTLNASGNSFIEATSASGGTRPTTGVQEISLLARYNNNITSGTLQTLVSDATGALKVWSNTIYNPDTDADVDTDTEVSDLTGGHPLFTLNGVLNESDGAIHRMRNTASLSGGTLTMGLLATGGLGSDGSAWRPILTDTGGREILSASSTVTSLQGTDPWIISGTVNIGAGTHDIDIVANSVGLMQSTSGTLAEVTLIPTVSTVSNITTGTLAEVTLVPNITTVGTISNITTGTLAEVTLVPNVTTVGTVSSITSGNITTTNSSTANVILQTDNIGLMKSTGGSVTTISSGTTDIDIVANSIGLMSNTGGSVTAIPSGTQDIDIIANSIGLMQSTNGTLTSMHTHYDGSAWVNRNVPVINDVQYVAAVTSGTIWTPAGGKKFVMTDMMISTKDATGVSILDGTTKIFEAYLAANGGVVTNLKTPIQSTTSNNSLHITTDTASTLSITTTGYEI